MQKSGGKLGDISNFPRTTVFSPKTTTFVNLPMHRVSFNHHLARRLLNDYPI
jgi:hypothetical protein